MFSDHKTTNKYLALFTFAISLIIYTLTLAPTASFWDAGEFIAVAHGLQVNHPPGAPFYSILGRIFSMFMPTEYVALSINFISALASALTVMLLYLIIIRLIREWKGEVSEYSLMDKIGMYGGALVGSLTFAVTDTFWFNAVEAEVYALSMFFTAIVVWLALKWSERHEEPYNERWLVMIAYMFGLAIGVHLLNLLALFFVALIIYFKKKDLSLMSFVWTGVAAVISFFLIYPVTIQWIPDFSSKIGDATYGLIGPLTFIALIMIAVAWGIYYTQKKRYRFANIVMISYAMILIGYSSYSIIMIRSIADPPIDENDPETVEAFVKYLKREQYGSTPILKGNTFDEVTGQVTRGENNEVLFPRRHSSDPRHVEFYSRYNSDWDFFWSYQVNHMYIRYFNWNFIGRQSDIQDTGWQSGFEPAKYPSNKANNAYFFIPFVLGLFGLVYHFSADWKRASAVMALFIVTGLAIIVFLNQPPFQPRERDYAYVGSFFAFAIWIGIGVTGLIDLLKSYIKENSMAAYAVVGVCLLASPVWMGYQNWDDHDRSERYVAPDYAKNLLNSLAPNAIVFTNGDNDTFPLWYAQEVEGIRTDVRIVCLSLLNTDWYIKQLRDQWSHESAPLPINMTDKEVEAITGSITQWQPKQMQVPVDKEMLREAFSEDQNYKEAIGVKQADIPILQTGTEFTIPVDSLDDVMTWQLDGRRYSTDAEGNGIYFLQTQDRMILELIQSNNWLRPIYFANTVSSQSQLNLQDYFRAEGKAYRLVPKKMDRTYTGYIDAEVHAERMRNFSFRNWNDPDVYVDENIRRMMGNYRYSFLQLAEQFIADGKPDSAKYWLKYGEEKVPFRPDDEVTTVHILYANKYATVGMYEEANSIMDRSIDEIQKKMNDAFYKFIGLQDEMNMLNAEYEQARRNADLKKQRTLRTKLNATIRRAQEQSQTVMRERQVLVLSQYVYFKSGNDEKALAIAESTNSQFEGTQIPPVPATKEETMRIVTTQYGIN
jgi:tetratricopeptide (TPR) repeat protein